MAAPRPNGNDRTGQATQFMVYDTTTWARIRYQSVENQAERAERIAAQPYDGIMDMTNLAERWGRAVQVSRFIHVLRLINPALIFELSRNYPDKYGIYTTFWRRQPHDHTLVGTKRFVVGMESGLNFGGIGVGYMPEFSIIVNEPVENVDPMSPAKAPRKFKREIRGWRTVLAALIIEGLVTEAQVEKRFMISAGRDSANWQARINKPLTIS